MYLLTLVFICSLQCGSMIGPVTIPMDKYATMKECQAAAEKWMGADNKDKTIKDFECKLVK